MTEMSIRKHKSFIPKFFRLFSFFIIATLCSFFGCIEFFDVTPTQSPVPEDSTDAFEEDPVSELFANLMGLQNLESDFNLTFQNQSKDISLSAQGNVMFEMEDMAVAVDLDLVYNGAIFDVKAKYLEPNFYLEINENVYKFDTASSGGEVDFNAILDFVKENFDIDLSSFSDIGKDLGLDFENLDLNSLIAKVSNPEYKELDNGKHKFVFNVSNVISAVLVTDASYNIESINLNDILLKGSYIKFNMSNTRMNQSDIDVSYGETGDEIDLSGLNKYISYFQNTFKNPYVLADIDINVDNKVYEGKLLYQNDGVQQFKLTTNVEGIDVEIALSNNHVYLDACNQKLSFNLDDYKAWETEINRIVEKHTSKTVAEIVNEIIYKQTSINPEEMTSEEMAVTILGAFFGNSDKIDAFLPDDTVETEADLTMVWNNGLSVTMAQTDNLVSKVKVNYSNVECLADLSIANEGFEIYGVYYDVTNLLPLLNVADEVMTTKQFGGEIEVEYAEEKLIANYRVDFADGLIAEVTLKAFGEDIAVYLSGRDIYVQVGGMVLGGSLDDLNTYISQVKRMLGKTETETSEESSQSLANVVGQVVAILSEVKLASESGYIAVVEYLSNTGYISIEDGKTVIAVEAGEIKVSLDMLATTGETITVPAETDSVEDILAKAENLKAYVEGKKYAFNFAVEAVVEEKEVSLSGTVQVDLDKEDLYVTNLTLGETELKVAVRYVNNTAYVEYSGLKMQVQVDKVMTLVEVITKVVNANLPEQEVEEESTEDMLTKVMLEIFGEDIRTKSLKDILKSITIDLRRAIVDEDSLTIEANMSSETPVKAIVVVDFAGNNVAGARVEYETLKASVEILNYTMPTFVAEEYYNITSKHAGEVTVKYNNGEEILEVVVDVELDLTEGVYLRATTTIADNEIELLFKNERLTLTVGEFRVGAYITKASEIWETVSTLLDVAMPESGETEKADVEEILASVVGVDLSEYVTLTGSALTVKERAIGKVTISATLKDEQNFSQTEFADKDGEVFVYDLTDLLPFVEIADEVMTTKQFSGEIEVEYTEEKLTANYRVDFADELVAEVTLKAFGEDIAVYLSGRDIYVQVGGMVLGGSLDDLNTYISQVKRMLGKTETETSEESSQSLANVVGQVVAILSEVKLASESGYIAVVEYLSNTGYISIEDGKTVIAVEAGEIKVSLDMLATTGEEITVPAETDSVEDMLAKAENLKAYVEGKKYAFNFAVEAVVEEKEVSLSGTVQVDLEKEDLYVTNLTLGETELKVAVRYVNNTAYVEYSGLKMQVQVDKVMTLVEVVTKVVNANLPEQDVEVEEESTEDMLTKVMLEIFGEDIRTKSLKDILKSITIDLRRAIVDEDSLTIEANMSSETPVNATVVVDFAGNNVAGARVEYETLKASVEILNYTMPTLVAEEYYNITSKHTGEVTVKYNNGEEILEVVVDVELDLTEGVYLRATTTIADNEIELLLKNERLTLTVGEFRVGAYVTKASEIWETVSTILDVAMPESGETEKADVEEILASVVGIDLSEYVILTGSALTVKERTIGKVTIGATLKDEQSFSQTEFADKDGEIEIFDINEFLPKAISVYNYVKGGVYEFDFAMSYNGFPFEGTFKFNNKEPLIDEVTGQIVDGQVLKGEMEIVLKNICGQGNFVIRIRDGAVYISYGNIKVQAPLSQGSGEPLDYKQLINDLLTDAFGIKLQFGIFEQFMIMARDYSLKDYIENLTFDMNYETDKLSLKLYKKLEVINDWFANLVFNFNSDKLTTIDIDLLDIIEVVDEDTNKKSHTSLVDISIKVSDVEASTIEVLNESEYQSYATNYLDGLLDSLKVENADETAEIYAFSSDIAIRYSTIDFYGKLTAMLVKNELGEYSPAILVETTALGLQSYIYLIGETIYIDINGLQIKADLNETTINEIMSFVEEKFGITMAGEATETQENSIEPLAETVEVFKVIIPAIDKIYGSWISVVEDTATSYGVQILIDDKLQYAENAFFDDIVLQAFADTFTANAENAQSTIIPTKIVLGANITDANTIPHYEEDYFKDYWLSNGVDENNNPIVVEDVVTKQLNFAVYLTNIVVGATNNLDLNAVFGSNFVEISTLKSNYGTSPISDFNHYQNVLDLVETAYDYGMGLDYQANISASISNNNGDISSIGGDVVIKLNELSEDVLNDTFVLFGNKGLKVQGNLELVNVSEFANDKHLIDILYDSNSSGAIYASYTHDNYLDDGDGVTINNNIGSHVFRAKINNSNLSGIISMVVALMNVELGEGLSDALNIQPSTTDFRYIQSLMGIGGEDIGDDISKVDSILSSVESITKMLNNINLKKVVNDQTGLFETTLTIQLDMATINNSASEQIGSVAIKMSEELIGSSIVKKLKQIELLNIIMGENTINVTIDIQDFSESSFDYDTSLEHIDLSEIQSFADIAVSTLNQKSFNFKGATTVQIPVLEDIDVGFDIFASIDENNKIYAYVELDVNFVASVTGQALPNPKYTNYIVGGSFDKRISTLVFENDTLTITQKTYGVKKTAVSKKQSLITLGGANNADWVYTKEELKNADYMIIVAQALGLSQTVIDIISYAIKKIEAYPTIERSILGFAKNSNDYNVIISGENLMGMSGMKDVDIKIGTSSNYLVNVNNETLGQYQKSLNFIETISATMNLSDAIIIPLELKSVSGLSYTTYDGKTIYTNDYYRRQYINTIGTLVA